MDLSLKGPFLKIICVFIRGIQLVYSIPNYFACQTIVVTSQFSVHIQKFFGLCEVELVIYILLNLNGTVIIFQISQMNLRFYTSQFISTIGIEPVKICRLENREISAERLTLTHSLTHLPHSTAWKRVSHTHTNTSMRRKKLGVNFSTYSIILFN